METILEIQQRVMTFEGRFLVMNQYGRCVDWCEARGRDPEGFRLYMKDRQLLRATSKGYRG
jgi:hypothetical protein